MPNVKKRKKSRKHNGHKHSRAALRSIAVRSSGAGSVTASAPATSGLVHLNHGSHVPTHAYARPVTHSSYAKDDLVAAGFMAAPVLALVICVGATMAIRGGDMPLDRIPIVALAESPAPTVLPDAKAPDVKIDHTPSDVASPANVMPSQIVARTITSGPVEVPELADQMPTDASISVQTDVPGMVARLFVPPPARQVAHVKSGRPARSPASKMTSIKPTPRLAAATAPRILPVIAHVPEVQAPLTANPKRPPAVRYSAPSPVHSWDFEGEPQVCRVGDDRVRPRSLVTAPVTSLVQSVAPQSTPIPIDKLSDAVFGERLAAAAAKQLERFVIYNEVYLQIAYPMGDIPALFGVCTDVVIRAYRELGIDLQELVHQSRVGSGDRSIDHRRTKTLRRFFSRNSQPLPVTDFAEDYLPGDIVTYFRPQNRGSQYHIAVVANEIAPSGRPMISLNRGWGPQSEDGLFVDNITGHYRFRSAPNIKRLAPSPVNPKIVPQLVRRDAKLDIENGRAAPTASR